MSLAAGIAVAEALQGLGVSDLWLKWPNDIYRGNGKLGGLLVEVSGEANGPCQAIIGLGLNVQMPDTADPGQAWADLSDHDLTDRNKLIAHIYTRLHDTLHTFSVGGLAQLRDRWQALDGLQDRRITVHAADGPVSAVARGISKTGGLKIAVDGQEQTLHADEVSIRVD